MAQTKILRRSFLAQSAAAATATFAAPAFVRSATLEKELHVAAIGVNGMGWADLSSVGSHAKVKFVGFCDIDAGRFDKVDAQFPGVKHFSDYRILLTELADKVDAVIVSTPDHMHAPVAMMAMKMGKHIYCQKPLTHTVWESRQMSLLAAKMNLTTQMGNQIHSAAEYRLGVKLIKDGAIGKIKEVHSWVGVQGRTHNGRTDRPPAAPVPAGVDWDLWLGAAPERPFAAEVYHPFKWRDWQDFGSGALGDFGCHILDPVFTAIGIKSPTSIMAENDGTTSEVWPGPETVTYEFPGNELTAGPTLKVIWRDGGLKPPRELAQLPDGVELPAAGSVFIGEGGVMVLPHVGKPALYPQAKFADYKMPEVAGTNHWHDWVDATLAGTRTTDGFDYAGPLSETVQLGNIAARLPGVKLEWDAAAMKVTNHEAANKLLTKSYRKGFEVEAVS
ncbi:MAG: gfo/Idh/MocA family oxidoreductase [Planctomycetota bacterium]|nr:MAG: gfo/Idh/MocA family oxidoreductase [Planctomycetota bacterium]